MRNRDDVRRVAEIMTTEVITTRPHETVTRALRVMRERKIHAMPVLDDFDRLLGIVTTTDLAGRGAQGERATVGNVMTRRVFVLPPDANLLMLVRLMKRWRIHHVVVTEEVGKVVGIVSAFDLLDLVEELGARRPPSGPAPAGRPSAERLTHKGPPPRLDPPHWAEDLPEDVACPTEDPEASDIGLTFLENNPDDEQGA